MTILIVEDSCDLRELLARVVEELGFTPIQAKHGRAALEYLLNNPLPSLILLDSEMDVMNGKMFLEELDELDSDLINDLRIIALSGSDGFSHSRIMLSMRKPIDLDRLEAAIVSAMPSKSKNEK